MIVVVPQELIAGFADRGITAVAGGATRQASVNAGLELVDTPRVLIHDAARPFVSTAIVADVVAALDHADGAFAAIPVRETLAHVKDARMAGVVPRESLLSVQTPQAFATELLRSAHERALADGIDAATDDAQIVAHYGHRVVPVQGDARNMKVTYPEDFELAEALIGGAR